MLRSLGPATQGPGEAGTRFARKIDLKNQFAEGRFIRPEHFKNPRVPAGPERKGLEFDYERIRRRTI